MSESLELASLRALAAHVGARVTDTTTPGVHSATSYHYAAGTGGTGLAIDIAEPSGPSHDTPGLLALSVRVAQLIGPQCAELIYAGGVCLKNGKPYRYSASVLAAHHNHVHVAVNRGFRFVPPKEAPVSDPNTPPNYAVNAEPISIAVTADGNGYVILCKDGGVITFGNAKYLGRVHKAS